MPPPILPPVIAPPAKTEPTHVPAGLAVTPRAGSGVGAAICPNGHRRVVSPGLTGVNLRNGYCGKSGTLWPEPPSGRSLTIGACDKGRHKTRGRVPGMDYAGRVVDVLSPSSASCRGCRGRTRARRAGKCRTQDERSSRHDVSANAGTLWPSQCRAHLLLRSGLQTGVEPFVGDPLEPGRAGLQRRCLDGSAAGGHCSGVCRAQSVGIATGSSTTRISHHRSARPLLNLPHLSFRRRSECR
jgi:hypothetical protein